LQPEFKNQKSNSTGKDSKSQQSYIQKPEIPADKRLFNKVNQEIAKFGIVLENVGHSLGAQYHGKLKGLMVSARWAVDFEKFWEKGNAEDQEM
jgi:hypothetical protein